MTQHTPGTLDIVDLSQPDRRVTPTLANELILGDPTRPIGRASQAWPPSRRSKRSSEALHP